MNILYLGLWRKSSQETSRMSSVNNQPTIETHEHHLSPWYWHNNNLYAHAGFNMGPPQSPICPYHHHSADPVYCRTSCMPSMTPPNNVNDSMLLQQFIQTQQMLINSMSQCNQLLWDQQREINNLNSAVLLVMIHLIYSFEIFEM